MVKDLTETMSFKSDEFRRNNIKNILKITKEALDERGYNAVNQLAGYLISNDPAYISSHKNARSIIQSLERYEIIEELVRYYLEDNQK
ncbi:IreB family regulatory phosphoprotein [Erysipelotrichaceae bacterium OH741_COT-311]|nr:IreB family regulatory phosphoprotein [Erysipelotrichaceae bacterium]RRC94239.1 IreB family regulatory phosphoprotein [Erysipelotrichaceae bacterium OH741_COT-311]